MADENMERRMDYIAEQQARSAIRMAEIEDIIVRFGRATRGRFEGTDKRIDDVDEKIAAVVDSQIRAEERSREIDKKIAALIESQARTEQNVTRTAENVKKTDEALRSLTTLVDRYISRRRNGDSNDTV